MYAASKKGQEINEAFDRKNNNMLLREGLEHRSSKEDKHSAVGKIQAVLARRQWSSLSILRTLRPMHFLPLLLDCQHQLPAANMSILQPQQRPRWRKKRYVLRQRQLLPV
jgi:hypothetical protein